jgi:hypothetical protein
MALVLKAKKITLATVKSFVKRHQNELLINVTSRFDGMTDMCESRHDGFKPVKNTDRHVENTLGIEGAWFVGHNRDYFSPYSAHGYTGIEVSNSCGCFILAIQS